MCGILGASGKHTDALRTAARTIAHRGPDASASYESAQFSLWHHRLAIIDLDARSTQPLVNDDATVRIVYNGEIYNYKQLRAELAGSTTFKTESDTEVILRGYECWGLDVFSRLKGMFALAILDEKTGMLHLARDHAGIKPLYYHHRNGSLVFASEVKAIATYLKEVSTPAAVNHEALPLFLALGYIPAPQTLLKGVFSIPPSSGATFVLQTGELTFWKYATEVTPVPVHELQGLLEERVLRHLIADVPVGLFFSGGVDSSLIAAILAKHRVNLSTWSIGLPGKEGDRQAFTAIAKELGIRANVAEFGPKELDAHFEEVMSRIDEPTSDNSLLPTHFVSTLAAREVKIVLSGEGGDEYFLGYERMRALAHMQHGRTRSVLDPVFTRSPDFHGKNKLFLDLYRRTGDAAAYYLLSMSPARNLLSPEAWQQARSIVAATGTPTNYDAALYLENDLLRKTDMATMYTSIEGRVPLLDPDVIASARAISTSEHFAGGETKAVLKRILATYISPELVYRKKSGFGVDLSKYWDASKVLRPALHDAEVYLHEQGIDLHIPTGWEQHVQRYPNLSFGLITLARALQNIT